MRHFIWIIFLLFGAIAQGCSHTAQQGEDGRAHLLKSFDDLDESKWDLKNMQGLWDELARYNKQYNFVNPVQEIEALKSQLTIKSVSKNKIMFLFKGCNGITAIYKLDATKLVFSIGSTTQKGCTAMVSPNGTVFESTVSQKDVTDRVFMGLMQDISSVELSEDKATLYLRDAKGGSLGQFQKANIMP